MLTLVLPIFNEGLNLEKLLDRIDESMRGNSILYRIVASFFFRAVFPTRGVRDFTCGYRAYRASILRRVSSEYGDALFEFDGFQCMADLLLKLRAAGARFYEVPLVLRYDLKQGQSKMRVLRTVRQTLQLAFWRRVASSKARK